MNIEFEIDPNDDCDSFIKKINKEIPELFFNLSPGKWILKFEKPKRTCPQNSRYWGMIIVAFAEFTGYDKDEVHQILSKRFLSYEKAGKKGSVQLFVKSTTQLNTKEFAMYCDKCELFGVEFGMNFEKIIEQNV